MQILIARYDFPRATIYSTIHSARIDRIVNVHILMCWCVYMVRYGYVCCLTDNFLIRNFLFEMEDGSFGCISRGKCENFFFYIIRLIFQLWWLEKSHPMIIFVLKFFHVAAILTNSRERERDSVEKEWARVHCSSLFTRARYIIQWIDPAIAFHDDFALIFSLTLSSSSFYYVCAPTKLY